MKLSILICTLNSRFQFFSELMKQLNEQKRTEVEVLFEKDDGQIKIGDKRNNLLKRAKGDYVAFIDDDDSISSDYIEKALKAIESNPDCCSLTGIITWDGVNPEIFEHSIKYSAYKTNANNEAIKYERYPNHLNIIKREIAQQFSFVSVNHGEDTEWATQIFNAGVLKTEATIEGVIYHYKYRAKK
jgi:glycosyltransferase involved in cell wall biosynthesis